MSDNIDYDDKVCCIIIGDSSVGKTSIISKYFEGKDTIDHLATAGIGFYYKNIEIGNKLIKLKIWDTAGQEKYKSLTSNYYKNAQGVILVYDVSNRESYNNLKNWVACISENYNKSSNVQVIVIGNKIDLTRNVSKQEAEEFCKEYNYPYFETSALKNIGLDEAFRKIVFMILSTIMNIEEHYDGFFRFTLNDDYTILHKNRFNLSIDSESSMKKKSCC
jgi:Ras-related protein Rab-1A